MSAQVSDPLPQGIQTLLEQWREIGEFQLHEAADQGLYAAMAAAAMKLVCADQLELVLHKFVTVGDSDNPIRALNTHGQTETCLEHRSQLSSGKGHAGISPQASGQRDQIAERPTVTKPIVATASLQRGRVEEEMTSCKPIPSLSPDQEHRFWERVGVDMYDVAACWPWKGRVNREGYVSIGLGSRSFFAHRVAYTLTRGPIPDGLTIDHTCGNRRCMNPAHMEPVSASENVKRRVASVTGPSKYQPRKRTAERYSRRRERGMCVQCNTPSEKYRCDRCGAIHNERSKVRRSTAQRRNQTAASDSQERS